MKTAHSISSINQTFFIVYPLQVNTMKPIEIIIAAINHIEAHLGTPLTLEKVARRLGYSRYYLHHLFT